MVFQGELAMGSGVVAGPETVEMMARVLDAYCSHAGVVSHIEREHIAVVVLALYETGIETEDGLLAELLKEPRSRTG